MNKIIISFICKYKVLRYRLSQKPLKKRKQKLLLNHEALVRLVNVHKLEFSGMMISKMNFTLPPPDALVQATAELRKVLDKWEKKEQERRRKKYLALRLTAMQQSWVLRKMTLALCMMM